MSEFKDVGRQVLAHQIAHQLADYEGGYNLSAIVEEFVRRFGFVDVDEVDPEDFAAIVLMCG